MTLVHEKGPAATARPFPISRAKNTINPRFDNDFTRRPGVFVRLSRSMILALLVSQAAVFVSGVALMIGGAHG